MFRNVPVSVLGWHIRRRGEDKEKEYCQCSGAGLVFNDAFCRMTGYTTWEVEQKFGCCIGNMVVEEDREMFKRALHELGQYPHERELTHGLIRKDGEMITLKQKLSSVRQADGTIWVYAVTIDAGKASEPAEPKEQAGAKRVVIQTFGYFNVLIDGRPIAFQHEKAKELLALLVDRKGKYVSSSEIISCLWEDEPVCENTRSRCRKAVFYLRETLEKYGVKDIIESTSKGYRRICTDVIDCDLYRYLDGEPAYARAFRGAYMTDYSWGKKHEESLCEAAVYGGRIRDDCQRRQLRSCVPLQWLGYYGLYEQLLYVLDVG